MKSEFKTAAVLGVMILAAVGIITVMLAQVDSEHAGTDKSALRMAPDIVGIAHYLNTSHAELAEEIKDKVVLYDIWTYSCINCIRTLPYITAWNDKYADEGLLIIGIHTPEFEFEKNLTNVQMAVDKHGIIYPVVMDNDWETWDAFENRYWPRKYIADHEGYIRYDHIGEGAYKETEQVIQKLLEERAVSLGLQAASAQPLVDIEEFEHTSFRTPELYFGHKFMFGRNHLGSGEGFTPGQTVEYAKPASIDLHKFYPVGKWRSMADSMQLESDAGSVELLYQAKQVNIVTANEGTIEVFLDGVPLPAEHAGEDITDGNILQVKEPGLYNIINSNVSSVHSLELRISGQEFQIFTFTFG